MLRGDRDALTEAVLDGVALLGTIVAVADEGSGRATVPVWTLDARLDDPTRIREGSKVEVAQMPGRTGAVRSVTEVRGRRWVEVEIVGRKTASTGYAHGASPSLVGQSVVLIPQADGNLARIKSGRVWAADGAGAWLTHGGPMPPEDPPVRRQKDLVDLVEALGGT